MNIFSNSRLHVKLIIAFLLVVLVPMLIVSVNSERLVRKKVLDEIEKATKRSLETAWGIYHERAQQMKLGMLQGAEEIEEAIVKNDRAFLRNKLEHWKTKRPYVDLWTVVDKSGKVLARINSALSGDIFELNGVVERALSTGVPSVSSEIMTKDMLLRERGDLANSIIIPVEVNGAEMTELAVPQTIEDALIMMVVVPVMDKTDVVGAIITGDIINKDNFIPDTIVRNIPGVFSSISIDGIIISTTMPNALGMRAIGNVIPLVLKNTAINGNLFENHVTISGEKYIAVHDSIKDNAGNVIGKLIVGVPQKRFMALHRENRFNILLMAVAGVLLAVIAGIFVTYRITRSLSALAVKTKDIAAGNLETIITDEASENTKDEVSLLTRAFNSMILELRERNRDKERYLLELEKKSIATAEANEKLNASNQELEVALEESQSQQEELQSVNEELEILNEELEKKTNELYDANMQITREEAELKQMRDQLKLIFDGIQDYIFLLDPSCRILDVNRSFLNAYDLKEEDVIGKTCFQMVYGLDNLALECDNSTGGDIKAPHRKRVITGDNTVLERFVFPVLDADGNLINKIEYIRDVTVETQLREQLIQTEKLSSLGEIMSGVAHELNNPLTGVIGYCELLFETTNDPDLKDQLGKINNAALRCKKIIQNMLDFARQHKIEKQYSDLNDIIMQTIELKSYQLKVDNIELDMDLDKNLPGTMVDPHMIQQVVLNIINNAHSAMAEKGEGGSLSIKTEQREGKILISFKDTGTGIPEKIINKIFDPFFTTKGVGKGTGLGLSVSYGIIKEHSGDIYAVSRPGNGTTFFIELPIIKPENAMAKEKSEAPVAERSDSKSKKRILVVDDESTLLDLLKTVIEEAGHEVQTTSDAREAIEKIKNASYDLILSDMKMPEMDGQGFYSQIKNLCPEMIDRTVFITGDVINQETRAFLKDSCCRYLEKPFTPTELKAFISDFFRE